MKYLASFHTTLKVSRYLFRALAVLLWMLIAFVSVFYIVNALHDRESEIRQEFNLKRRSGAALYPAHGGRH
ncbi:Sensor kinase protein RcsC [Raoultella terrigena]|uniref:Sensor kinase protein RcsC n=1 Tax=Raoultella terrigena TaxID=577 RepID=A0A4U9CX75_RAOTE|nr:Sensor kinase protein RcsC [Raoultella terrigena]